MGLSKSNAKGKFHSNTSLPQETREKSNKYLNFTPKATRKKKKEMENPMITTRKERHHKNQGRNKGKTSKRDHSKNQQS